jgi:hypothetical protein
LDGWLASRAAPIRRAYNYVKEKLDSKSPLELLPKTWRDYIELYTGRQSTAQECCRTVPQCVCPQEKVQSETWTRD